MRSACTKCGSHYENEAWATLTLSHRIEGAELRQHVVGWPEEMVVEVRLCASCSSPIAAKRAITEGVFT